MRRSAKAENLSKLVLPPELSADAVIAARNAGIAADQRYWLAPRLHLARSFSLYPVGKLGTARAVTKDVAKEPVGVIGRHER